MRGHRVSGHQRVPVGQASPVMQQSVGTGFGHPIGNVLECIGAQNHTFRDDSFALCIIGASAGCIIEQAAGDAGEDQFVSVDIFKLVQAAFPATIAQTLPFLGCHSVQRDGFPISVT